MKLLTHNILMCNKKGCSINNYPLKINANKIITKEHIFDEDSLKRFVKKIDFKGLKSACNDLNINLQYDFESLTEEQKNNSEFLKYMNNILFEIIIEDGILKCNNCGREYKIENGITNLMLNDDEI
jgi:multifunctional methyltransferase subunit TRM112